MLPDRVVRLSEHGYYRLVSEEMLVQCPGCKAAFATRPGHDEQDQFYHVAQIDYMDFDEAVGIVTDVLAEALH